MLATLMQALDDENALVRFADNVRGHELSGSGAVVSTVAAGEMRVGVALYETAKKRMLAGEHIAVIWPKEGTSAVPDGAAVLAAARMKRMRRRSFRLSSARMCSGAWRPNMPVKAC